MPGIKLTGTNTAASIKAIATTGPEISFMALDVASTVIVLHDRCNVVLPPRQ